MKKNRTRIGALLMAMVMMLSMLPLNTMAAFVGSETGQEIVNFGGNTAADVDPGYGAVWGQFTRFTLVKLNFAHNDNQISDPDALKKVGAVEIMGSIDVAPNNTAGNTGYRVGVKKSDAEKVNTWWDTNALSYLLAAENGGGDGATRAQNVMSYAQGTIHADTKNKDQSWVNKQFFTYTELLEALQGLGLSDLSSAPENLAVWGTAGIGNNYLSSIFSNSDNMLDPSVGTNGKSNDFFDKLLQLITRKNVHPVTAEEFGNIHGTKESGGYTYRLLVEPGWVMAINNNRCAATLRDMAAYVLSEWNDNGHINGTGATSAKTGGKLWYAHYNGSRQLAYGLFTGQDEFFAYQWADGSSTPVPVDSNGNTIFMKPVENTSTAKDSVNYNLGWFAGTMFGIGGDGIKSTSYSVGQCVGYGLGIVSPYDFKPNGLTVEKVLVGDYNSTAADREWEFTLRYTTDARPNNVVLTADGNSVSKEDTSNGFKFTVKAGSPVNITFERDNSSEHVHYFIEETDPEAANYAQTITMNGEDSTVHKGVYGNTSGTMHSVFTNSAGVTIRKTATGFGADEVFNFDILCSKRDEESDYSRLTANDATGIKWYKSDGTHDETDKLIWPDALNAGRFPFTLKNGESIRIVIPSNWNYTVTETNAGTGAFKTTVNETVLEDKSSYGNVAYVEPRVEFVNEKETPSGEAHVVIDYNLPGKAATDETGNPGIELSTIVDCDKHPVGSTVVLNPTIQVGGHAQNLNPSDVGTVVYQTTASANKNLTGDNATGNATANATFSVKFKGLFDKAEGGKKLDTTTVNGATYYVVNNIHEGMNTVYAQWETSLTAVADGNVVGDGDDDDDDFKLPIRDELKVAYFSENYIGGGLTSTLYGTFYVPVGRKYMVKTITITEDGTETDIDWKVGGEGDDWTSGPNDNWDISMTRQVDIPFAAPQHPLRAAWSFLGWTATDPDTLDKTADLSGERNLPTTAPTGAATVYSAGLNGNYFRDTAIPELQEKVVKQFNRANCANEFETDLLTPKPSKNGTTYYALWYARPIVWNANGGDFEVVRVPSGGNNYVGWQGIFYNDGDTHAFVWPGAYINGSLVPILGGNSSNLNLVRTGYDFDQWYYDKALTVPLIEQDTGVTPNRDYLAGWDAQKVKVTYYDSRQGTSVVETQWYDYDDYLDLLAGMNSTDGWTFSGWKVANISANGTLATPAVGAANVRDGMRLYEGNGITYHEWIPNADPKLDKELFENGVTSDAGYWTLDLVAAWNLETADYTVTVNWDDYDNNDGIRPSTMTIGLISSVGDVIVQKKDTHRVAGNQWVYEFNDLPINTTNSSVEKITYSFCILDYTDAVTGETYTVTDPEASSGMLEVATKTDPSTDAQATYKYGLKRYTGSVTGNPSGGPASTSNSFNYSGVAWMNHDLILTGEDIKYTIHWDDASNNDGVRPATVTLQLLANGKPVEGDDKTGKSGLVKLNPALCEVSEDGNTWTYIFRDYQKYTNKGQRIDYTVEISDYKGSGGVGHEYDLKGNNPSGTGVTLQYDVQTDDVPVTIIWDDELNRDGLRPSSVDVTLTAYQWNDKTFRWEEMLVGTKNVTGGATAEKWNVVFEKEKIYNGGQKIIYKASVSSDLNAHIPTGSNGYSWVGNETTITISHNKDVKDVPVTIHWDDHNNNDLIDGSPLRPTSVIVQLWADGVKVPGAAHAATVTGSDTDDIWSYTFKDMPIYRDGKSGEEIVYSITVLETVKDSVYGTYLTIANGEQQRLVKYTASYMYTDANGDTVTDGGHHDGNYVKSDRTWVRLTHDIDQGTIFVYASWHDEQNKDGKRPSSLQVELYKQVDGVKEYMRTLTLVAGRDNSWSNKITGLPLYENGKPITYLVDISEDFRGELESTYGYTVSTQDNVVHLYYTPQTGTVSTKLYWTDNDDNDDIRPDTVKATLYVNGVATDMTLDLNAENDWSATWTDLDTYFGDRNGLGQLTVYSVKVEDVDGYTVTYTPESVTTEDNQVIFINMNHGANLANVPVRIFWNDSKNMDGLRPENVTVQLYADGGPVVGKTLEVTGDKTSEVWSDVFENMPTHNNGEEIYYTVQVADTVGRTFETMTAGTSLYLSHDAQKGDLYVSFRFDDSNNADGYRPEGGYLQLQVVDADGNEENVEGANGVHTIYFDADGRVNDYFRGLPINKTSGSAFKYTVKVEWDDAQFGGKGEKYKVKYSRPIALSTVSQNQLVITAAEKNETGLGVELGTETGVVYWFDNNNQRGNRPPELMINVYNDVTSNVEIFKIKKDTEISGTVYDEAGNVRGTAEIDKWGQGKAATQWRYSIDKLPQRSVYENGQSRSIYYWATARDTGLVPWYTTTDGQRNGLDVLLTHVNYLEDFGSSTKDFDVHINWMDNQNAWGYRPDTLGVDVELYANEDKTPYKTVHMTMANVPEENENTWTYRFKDLPTYLNGNAVVWKVKINDLPWYTETVSNYADYSVIKMTQSIGFDFRINWEDEDNDDAVRPEASDMVLDIYADGKPVGSVVFTQNISAGGVFPGKPQGPNIMTGTAYDLPVWRETDTTVPVQYTFKWMSRTDGIDAYLRENGYSASASMNGEKIEDAANWYWLSAEQFGDKADAGLSDEGLYQWETTLTRSRDVIDVSASVNWDDDANRDGYRPESVKLQLLADGEPFGEPVEVSEETEWTYIWKDLPRNEQGTQVEYTVEIVTETVPAGYDVENIDATHITLFHEPEQITLLSRINWMDNTELHFIRNSVGDLVTTLAQIKRVPVYAQLLANGEPYGEPVFIGTDDYDTGEDLLTWTPSDWDGIYKTTKQIGYSGVKWEVAMANQSLPLYKFQNEGEEITYTFRIYSEDLNELLENERHKMTYSEDHLTATITRELFDVTGVVYYLYDTADEFLLGGVTVTAYLYDEATKTYTAVGTSETAEDGTFTIENLPNGMLTFRATYQYGDYSYAGSVGLRVDRHDGSVKIIVDRDAEADSDLYRYKAEGKAFYQTDITDPSTIHEVPTGSIVLLYKTVHGQADVQYVGMTTTGEGGAYKFENLAAGQYLVNVVFNHEGGTYTYDNADALRDGLTFNVLGADMQWPDIIKQVNKSVEPGPGPEDPDEPTPPDPVLPEPCIVSGDVFFSDNGVHTTDPVEGVDVYIYAAETNIELAHVVTDENGHWTVEGMGAQDYIAVFSYQGNASRVLLFTITDADYEAGTYEAATQYFDRTTKEPTALIQGVVLDEQGERTSALVQILNEQGNVVAVAYTDKTGAYSFTVPAGLTYQVRILEVAESETSQFVGDPDDSFTTLDYYVISGNFSIEGVAQSGATVAVYKQDEALNFNLLTATLTDENGDYAVKLLENGNYNVVTYLNGEIYSQHKVSVGYQEWEPHVTEQNGTYTISGKESFDALELRDVTTGVVHLIETLNDGEEYSISGLAEGFYDIKIIKGLDEKHYYIDCPKNEIDVTYFVTLAGSVLHEDGKAVLGAIVGIYDENGNQVRTDTVITNGSYSYPELPEGNYEIRVKYPVAGETLADKTTAEYDSYGIRYLGGMPENGVWTWNINATKVSGNVKDQKGNPVAYATVVLKDNNDPSKAYGVIADENGNWSIGVRAGSYTADAMYELDADHIYHANETKVVIVGNSAVDGVELVINRYELAVTIVRDGDQMPLPGADVTVTLADGTEIWTGTADEDGKIALTVLPDNYKVSASYEDGEGEKTIRVGADTNETVTIGIPMYLTGTVYEFDGTTPVADAIVYYEGPTSGRIYTDKNGNFSLALMASEAGYYSVYAVASGSTSSRMMVFVGTDTMINIIMPEVIHETETHVLSGVVTDNDGNRLENAIVTVKYGDDKTLTMQTSTNEMGVYRFEVEDGTYYLTAIYEADNGYVYATNAERSVSVNGDDVLDANLTIILAFPVTVTVEDSDGNPVEGAEVFFSGAATGSIQILTDAEGKTETKLPGGAYKFFATIGNRETPVVNIEVKSATNVTLIVGLPGLAEDLPTVTPSDLTIDGYVIAPNGDPVEDATVTLLLFNKETEEWEVVETKNSDADGFYEFTGLEDGRYKVEIEYSLDDVTEGEHTRFQITGYALDGNDNPYVGATVNLYDGEDLMQTVYTDEQGYYEFLNLEHDGLYRVEIIPVNDEGEQTTIEEELTAEPSNTVIEGTVVDAAGRPVEGATVIVTDENGAEYKMTTEADGEYHFELDVTGEVTVTIIYPASYEVDTENGYEPDESNPNAPILHDDSYVISGYVHDTDGNLIEGAEVKLLDKDGNEIQNTTSNEDGYYEFDPVRPGDYTVVVIWGNDEKTYDIDANGNVTPDDPDPEDPEVRKIHVNGAVVTDHKRPLEGAVVTVRNADTGESFQLIADRDGKFSSGEMDSGRYELSAVYTHKYGTNSSDTVTVIRTQEDVALVIILSYVDDVNGDGKDETVFAGNDDEFDTPDDFYEADVGKDGVKDPVFAGEDGKPGTEDDYYPWDVDHDGEPEKVYVGEDRIPGTEDDWYPVDVDDNGVDDKVFIGEDCIPGTEDDWYNKDVDDDGDDEKVFIGDDKTPGTDDDWYEDDDGNKIYLRVVITFNANGGSVNGNATYVIPLRKLHNLPGADRNNNTFNGWFLQTSGGDALTLSQIKKFTENTTVYAHWTANSTSGGNSGTGGGGGGGSIGGGGGGGGTTITDPVTPLAPLVNVTFKIKGMDDTVVSVPNGELVQAPKTVPTGYKILGWFQTEDLKNEWDLSKDKVTKDMTLWAKLEYVGPSAYLTTDHIAYIGGMPDGNVYPTNNITRAEVAMIFYRLLNDETRAKFKTDANEFSDVNEGDWFNVAISTLSNMGIVKGRGNGVFDPTANISRAEFAVICSRFDTLSEGEEKTFSDIDGHWASKEIRSAAAKGWVKGYEDGTFRPNTNIARHETITLINRVLCRDTITIESIVTADPMITWPDNSDVNTWFYLAIQEATNGHHQEMKGEHEQWTSLTATHVTNE